MKVYKTMLSILDEKGPLPIPQICNEVNQVLVSSREKPVLPAHIKSIVTKKKDVFRVDGGDISIQPDKHPCMLIVALEGFGGVSYQLRVNFMKNRFAALEWRNKEDYCPFSDYQSVVPGDLEDFKRELYSMNIWEWNPAYRSEAGIMLEGKYWFVKLITKGKIYESEGTKSYPENWDMFCKAVEKLTGTPFH